MKIQMYPTKNEFGEYEDLDDEDGAGEFDEDFWLDFMHRQEMHGAHEAETPYGYATPYYQEYETASIHDYPFRYETQEYDPYGYLNHDIQAAYDHSAGLDEHLRASHDLRA